MWSSNLYLLLGMWPGEITPSIDRMLEVTHADDRAPVARLIAYIGREGHLAPFDGKWKFTRRRTHDM